MNGLAVILAQGIPLAPPLQVRLITLVVVELVLLATAVLLYVLWVRLTREPLDQWWERRKHAGFSPRTRALMEEEERERLAAEAAETRATGAPPPG
jgi:hypothetical protein